MKDQMMKIIKNHNKVVEAMGNADVKVNLFKGMELWHTLACEGSEITHTARECGIDAKCDMQSGKITVYGDLDSLESPQF